MNDFLNVLNGQYWHFQTFDDKGKDPAMANTFQGVSEHPMLKSFNSNGAGIFVAINEHQVGQPRKKNTTTKIRALFVDFDDPEVAGDKVKEISSVLRPTMVVESSPNKFHVYYVLKNPGQIPIPEFPIWQKYLAKTYGGDPKCIDTTRVMRMPGFIHQKGEPFETRIVYSDGPKYFVDDLISAFYGGRNNYFTSVAGRHRHAGLPPAQIATKLQDLNVLLNNQLDEDELERISSNMQTYTPDPKREQAYNLSLVAEELNLETAKNGRVQPTLGNMLKIVAHANWVQNNNFTDRIEALLPVPWARTSRTSAWEDSDSIGMQSFLTLKFGIDWPRNHVETAIDKVSAERTYDPLTDYLTGLKWDGEPRVGTVFERHLGSIDHSYDSAVAVHFFVGAVRRALEPGCKHDSMLVLVGDEGTGKSSFASLLSSNPEWYTDSIGDLRNKDSLINLHGRWIIEMSELKSMQGVSAEHAKAFISTQVDNIRLPYGRRSTTYPRRCIFIGTTNNEKFLTDSGANRRFLPIQTHGQIDRKAFKAEVDQLWAEAYQMYKDKVSTTIPADMLAVRRIESSEDGGYVSDIIRFLNADDCPEFFVPRDFYLIAVEGSSKERWSNDFLSHKRIVNASKYVFSLPEFSHWKHGNFMVSTGYRARCWKRGDCAPLSDVL